MVICAGVAPAHALALKPWATVNVCDTADHPDTIGVRGSQPGSSKGEQLFMRMRVQYLDESDNEWLYIGAKADSGFFGVGNGNVRRRQGGRNFTVRPPSKGTYVLRGIVDYEWRKGSTVVRRAQRRTRRGHPDTPGADPKNYTAETCKVS